MPVPNLDVFRKQLDELDDQLISLLAERFRITDQIGLYKSQNQLAPVDREREHSQTVRVNTLAREYGLDAKVAVKVLRLIIAEVVKRHKLVQCKAK